MTGHRRLLCAEYVDLSALPAICVFRSKGQRTLGLAESGSRLQHLAQTAWPGGAHDIDFHRGACRRWRSAQGQIAKPFARSRPHLPDAGGAAAPCRHPLYLFRSHRSEVLLRLRHDRARHRQFLHGDVLFPVGTVRLVRYRPEGSAELFGRSPASAWPALRDLRASRSFRSPITRSRCGTIPRSAFRNTGGI